MSAQKKQKKQHDADTVQEHGELEQCQQDLANSQERLIHLTADFDNFKKRVAREKAAWATEARNDVLRDMLTVVDDIERALADGQVVKEQHAVADLDQWIKGLQLIHAAQLKLLSKHGIVEIPTDASFDPHTHEAVTQVDSDEHESGAIVAVLEKGYRAGEVVLRPAKVTVAK